MSNKELKQEAAKIIKSFQLVDESVTLRVTEIMLLIRKIDAFERDYKPDDPEFGAKMDALINELKTQLKRVALEDAELEKWGKQYDELMKKIS